MKQRANAGAWAIALAVILAAVVFTIAQADTAAGMAIRIVLAFGGAVFVAALTIAALEIGLRKRRGP